MMISSLSHTNLVMRVCCWDLYGYVKIFRGDIRYTDWYRLNCKIPYPSVLTYIYSKNPKQSRVPPMTILILTKINNPIKYF